MSCESLKHAIDAFLQKADKDLEDELREAGFIDAEDTVSKISIIEEKLAAAFKEFTDMVLDEIESAEDLTEFAEKTWPKIKASDKLRDSIRSTFTDEMGKTLPHMTSLYATSIDPELTITQMTRRTTSWVKSWSNELADMMDLSNKNEIERILVDGLSEGKSIAEFTQDMLDSGLRDEYYKARRASLTEVLRAHSVAQQEAFIQSPAVEEKVWRHTGGHKMEPRQNHVEMNGAKVPKKEPFELIGVDGITYYPMYPRDTILPAGESVNCHCINQPVISEKILGLSLDERKLLQAKAIAEDDGAWEAELDAKNKARAGIE